MQQQIIKRRMHVIGLHARNRPILKPLPRQNPEFVRNLAARLPLPVGRHQTDRHVGGIIGIIFIIMEPCFFTSKIENRNQLHQKQHTKDQIPVSFLHIPSCPQTVFLFHSPQSHIKKTILFEPFNQLILDV